MALRLLRLPEVCDRLGLKTTSVYARIKDKTLPPPVALGSRSRAWPEHEIDTVIAAIIAKSSDEDTRALVRDLIAQRYQTASCAKYTAGSNP